MLWAHSWAPSPVNTNNFRQAGFPPAAAKDNPFPGLKVSSCPGGHLLRVQGSSLTLVGTSHRWRVTQHPETLTHTSQSAQPGGPGVYEEGGRVPAPVARAARLPGC